MASSTSKTVNAAEVVNAYANFVIEIYQIAYNNLVEQGYHVGEIVRDLKTAKMHAQEWENEVLPLYKEKINKLTSSKKFYETIQEMLEGTDIESSKSKLIQDVKSHCEDIMSVLTKVQQFITSLNGDIMHYECDLIYVKNLVARQKSIIPTAPIMFFEMELMDQKKHGNSAALSLVALEEGLYSLKNMIEEVQDSIQEIPTSGPFLHPQLETIKAEWDSVQNLAKKLCDIN